MKEKKTVDMLNGSIWDKMILFALPLAASSILQQLFNAADVAVVGQFAGSQALAAVGANGPVINLLVNLFVGLSIGTNVVVASFIGLEDKNKTSKAAHTSILVALISGLVLLVIGVLFARPILELMSTPENIISLAELYLKIYFLGMPFIMLYNFTSAILRSKGDTKRPLIALFISGIVNVILNLFFVLILHMSVEGVAIATVVSNIVSSLMLMYFLMHEKDAVKIELRKLRIDKEILVRIAKIGVPAGLQGMVFSISNVCIQSAINVVGQNAIAASSAALNYEYFAYYILSAFAQATVTFIGQNYAAKKYDRCKSIVKWAILLGGIFTMGACMLFVLFKHQCIGFFTSDAAVAKIAYTRMEIILPFQLLNMMIEILSGYMRGLGYSSIPALICVAGICGFRLLYLYTVYPMFASFDMIMIVYPISWLLTVIALLAVYFLYVKKRVYA